VAVTEDSDRTEALLWAAPEGALPLPPVTTRAQALPLDKLPWSQAETLFLRLLHTIRPVQFAKLFGVPGQAQDGIDAYARLPLDLTDGKTTGRDYITLQSRRVRSLTATRIKKAVDDFLKGEWAAKSADFYYATSFDLQDTRLDKALREQTERLAKLGIALVPWGAQEVSALLKDHPRIVDEFFGRPWVEAFCGTDAAQALSNNLTQQDVRDLRVRLRDLYRAAFFAQGAAHPPDTADPPDFVILDVDPHSKKSEIFETEQPRGTSEGQPAPSRPSTEGQAFIASRLGARRQSFRSAHQLLNAAARSASAAVGTIRADEWLAAGRLRLLIGKPGAGKSSLLGFTALDLLSSQPQSVALQREHGTDLPIWLPFGFLCRHLGASTENSIVSAAEAWLKSQSAADLWPLVERALQDDRLLLLVDGIDEWNDIAVAERALGLLEAFLGHTGATAILSTRPYAVDRLNWRLPWSQAEIAPLTDDQRRTIATTALRPPTSTGSVQGFRQAGIAAVETFLSQLAATPELAELSRSPLFLTLLAATWQGEPLPQLRFKIYERLVELLIEKHPQMRQRASFASEGPLPPAETMTLFAAVAYRLRDNTATGTVTRQEMRKLIVEAMTDDEVLGYEQPIARRKAEEVLAVGEDEFGLIVSHGAGTYGFLHRVILDHLAGRFLATLPADKQAEAVRRYVPDPAWRDVLLALLTAQVNPHATEPLITAALGAGEGPWPDVNGYELLAEALAAGVRLTPRAQNSHLKRLVERVETHPSLRHRAHLIAALTGTLANQAARSLLLPIMKRWLTAPRPDPSPTMWALRDLPLDDDIAAEFLLWGLRHPVDHVKLNASVAIAQRFGGQPFLVRRLVAFVENGPSAETQAAAILALGRGWSEAPETVRLVDWARCQPSIPLRLVSLDLLLRAHSPDDEAPFRPEERAWVLGLLHREGSRREPWPVVGLINAVAAGNPEAADFALETLQTNGNTGGDRTLAWVLACDAFADDDRFKDWVATQFADPEQRGLILYNVAMIPQRWRDDPQFSLAMRPFIAANLNRPGMQHVAGLAPSMAPEDARATLLGGLDTWRPYGAARVLADRYSDDEGVRNELTTRLHGAYPRAAPLAGVAIDVLGLAEGFAVLVDLLRQPVDDSRSEQRVVVAEATADAWIRLTDAANTPESEDAVAAQAVLASYDAAELSGLCTAVATHPLAWHAPSVIKAWPDQPAVLAFAEKLIGEPGPHLHSIEDTIPVAVLRAYCGRTDAASRHLLDKTLDLLKHIDPELREVLAFELTRSSLAAADLVDIMAQWRDEPDTQVRRNAFIGLIQVVKRHQLSVEEVAGPGAVAPEMQWLRAEIKEDLCAYGPELEDRRQLAWIGMLMLGDLTLSDGILETIGHHGQIPGVKLDVLFGDDVDAILLDLVAENWERLREHFGETLFERLNGTSDRQNRTAEEQRRYVMAALATTASRHPAIAEMLRQEASTDAALRHDRHLILWAKEENDGDEGALRALVSMLGGSPLHRQDPILAAVLDRESWRVPDSTFKSILLKDSVDDDAVPLHDSVRLAAYAQLFPDDLTSRTVFGNLEAWFGEERATRGHLGWDTTLALVFGAARPQDLPAILLRVHSRMRMGMSDLYLQAFNAPLLRRLQRDEAAVEALKGALRDPMNLREDSPIFAAPWDPIAEASPDLQRAQRTYLFAVVLRQCGALLHGDAVSAAELLAAVTPDTVVHNPFTGHEGPLRLAVLDIAV
jgi:hypothetical protein